MSNSHSYSATTATTVKKSVIIIVKEGYAEHFQ